MIRSFYHHGGEVPATDLNHEHMRAALADAGGVLWVDLEDVSVEDLKQVLGDVFRFHSLAIEECVQGVRRPKLDSHDTYVFLVVYADDQSTPVEDINAVELDVFLGPNFVVTHHPLPVPALDRVTQQVMDDEALMSNGPDRLVYELLDAIASDFGPTMNFLSAASAGVEVEVLTAPTTQTLRRMHELHRDILKTQRLLAAHRDLMERLASSDLHPITHQNRVYFRDLAERFTEMVDTADTLDKTIRDALRTHLSVVSSHANQLLRLVAALVAMLLPLTLLGILYDANVTTIPELASPYAALTVPVLTLLIAIALALYIYRRN